MKLLGRDIDTGRLAKEVQARLSNRGIREDLRDAPLDGEAPVEPHAFLISALEENVDPVEPVASGRSANPVRALMRLAARGLLEELFGRQRVFNTHVRELAAILTAEVSTLRARVAELERSAGAKPPVGGPSLRNRSSPRKRSKPARPQRP